MKTEHSDDIAKMPLEELIDAGILKVGQKVVFRYTPESGGDLSFNGYIRRNGIEVNGQLFSISYSAVCCLKSIGDQKGINGWLAWQVEDGRCLIEVYQDYRKEKCPPLSSRNYIEKYYRYPRQRDVVFIFGAGASYTEGAPLRKDILPYILESNDPDLQGSSIYAITKEFLSDNFIWDKSVGYYPELEEVFGFLDYFIQKGESLNRKYSLRRIIEIKESLIKLIHYIISSTIPSANKFYRMFWEAIYEYNTNISIITLNYDTYLEDGFLHMFPRNMYLDYCFSLGNYDHSDEIDANNWWINPREPVLCLENVEPVSIKIIKIHGSLNWKYCNCCNQVLLTPFDKKSDLGIDDTSWKKKPDDKYHTRRNVAGMRCSRDGNEFQTLLIPPSHMKNLSHPVISRLFIESSEEIRKAKKVVFVGYSLPELDVHMRAILKKSLRPETKIFVVDVNTSYEFQFHYSGLSRNIEFIPYSFQDFVNDKILLKKILML